MIKFNFISNNDTEVPEFEFVSHKPNPAVLQLLRFFKISTFDRSLYDINNELDTKNIPTTLLRPIDPSKLSAELEYDYDRYKTYLNSPFYDTHYLTKKEKYQTKQIMAENIMKSYSELVNQNDELTSKLADYITEVERLRQDNTSLREEKHKMEEHIAKLEASVKQLNTEKAQLMNNRPQQRPQPPRGFGQAPRSFGSGYGTW